MLPRITAVRHIDEYRIALTFSDGVAGEVDLRRDIVNRGGVFRQLEDLACFARVRVDPEAGTIVWANGVDLDPDVLYSRVTGKPLPHEQRASA